MFLQLRFVPYIARYSIGLGRTKCHEPLLSIIEYDDFLIKKYTGKFNSVLEKVSNSTVICIDLQYIQVVRLFPL